MDDPGAFVLVDGQFGSTGKGLAAAVLAESCAGIFDLVTSNAGPNSGHTSYHGDEKIVLQQLPTFGVISAKCGSPVHMHMNAGSIIDKERLLWEAEQYAPPGSLSLNPVAAVVNASAKRDEHALIERVGSTGKGTGAALAHKVMRYAGAVAQDHDFGDLVPVHRSPAGAKQFVEVSQGFSLSMNSGGFYPYCTSRDCTVAQAMADAGLHPSTFNGAMMVVRTYPIRVAGNSGPGYPDQQEISWGDLGVEPEITTVTKKVRRVFTWSDIQYIEALHANRPNMLFFNFLNYLPRDQQATFLHEKTALYVRVMGKSPDLVLCGLGAKNSNVEVAYA